MTLNDILSDEKLRQHEFPVAKNKIFLAHAGVCPLPRRVAQAMNDCANEAMLGDQEAFVLHKLEDARNAGAKLLNCQPDEVSLVGPTSLGLSFVAAGLKFRKGDNVLIYHDDYPSNVYPWMALAERGVKVRLLNIHHLGVIRKVDVMGQVDEDTRLVALASNHFISVENVDFLAADAHKWLLGPCGAGVFYVKKDLQEKLNPQVYGWHNVRNPNFVAQDTIEFRKGAAKFEAGTHGLIGVIGLLASMELALELGVENIARELLRKRAWLVPALRAKNYTVLNADAKTENASGITAFFAPDQDMAAIHQKLSDNGVVASLRTDRKGQKYIRLSPHFYNTDAELHRVLELL